MMSPTIIRFVWMLLVTVTIGQAKPLNSSFSESINAIDHGNISQRKHPFESQEQDEWNSALPTNEVAITSDIENETTGSAAVSTVFGTTVRTLKDTYTTTRPNPFSWFLTPLTQKIQFTPQAFLKERLALLREALNALGINLLQNATAKQLNLPTGLLHFTGPNDSGFFTNRLEPAGFLGGNGWFANKGGILGGPGAILSTGSFLTDYPTAYRK